MLKHFKQVSLLLAAGAMVLPISAYADLAPEKLETAISQQNGCLISLEQVFPNKTGK